MFRPTRFSPGTSGSGSGLRFAGTFGVTGGAASIAGEPRVAPEVVRSTGVRHGRIFARGVRLAARRREAD